jgi:hypothetical protein
VNFADSATTSGVMRVDGSIEVLSLAIANRKPLSTRYGGAAGARYELDVRGHPAPRVGGRTMTATPDEGAVAFGESPTVRAGAMLSGVSRLGVAFSGGVDSSVLLALTAVAVVNIDDGYGAGQLVAQIAAPVTGDHP